MSLSEQVKTILELFVSKLKEENHGDSLKLIPILIFCRNVEMGIYLSDAFLALFFSCKLGLHSHLNFRYFEEEKNS